MEILEYAFVTGFVIATMLLYTKGSDMLSKHIDKKGW